MTYYRRFSTSNCPTTELAWTNFELRGEIDKEVRINIENEAKMRRKSNVWKDSLLGTKMKSYISIIWLEGFNPGRMIMRRSFLDYDWP